MYILLLKYLNSLICCFYHIFAFILHIYGTTHFLKLFLFSILDFSLTPGYICVRSFFLKVILFKLGIKLDKMCYVV